MTSYTTRPAGRLIPGDRLKPHVPGAPAQTVTDVKHFPGNRVQVTTDTAGTWDAQTMERMEFPRRRDGSTVVHDEPPQTGEFFVGDRLAYLQPDDAQRVLHPRDAIPDWDDLDPEDQEFELVQYDARPLPTIASIVAVPSANGVGVRIYTPGAFKPFSNITITAGSTLHPRNAVKTLKESTVSVLDGVPKDRGGDALSTMTKHGPYVHKNTGRTAFFLYKSSRGRWPASVADYDARGQGEMLEPRAYRNPDDVDNTSLKTRQVEYSPRVNEWRTWTYEGAPGERHPKDPDRNPRRERPVRPRRQAAPKPDPDVAREQARQSHEEWTAMREQRIADGTWYDQPQGSDLQEHPSVDTDPTSH